MKKRLIGGAVAFVLAAMLSPAETVWAAETPTPPQSSQVSGTAATTDPSTQLVSGDQAGDLVEGPQQSISAAGGHIKIDGGWYYTIPVYYVKFDWSYTWKLKNAIDAHSGTLGLLCGYLPNRAAVTTCGSIYSLFASDIKATVNAAISHGKCYKVRLPLTFGGANLAAYDSYYVTC